MSKSKSCLVFSAVLGLLAAHFLLGYFSCLEQSVTVDEFVHLPVGWHTLRTHQFRMENRNPPLVRMLAALPLWLHPPKMPGDPVWQNAGAWNFGYEFMRLNAGQYHQLFLRGRIVILCLSLLLGILVYFLATQMFGRAAGLTALFLYCLNPDVIAHAQLATLDLGLSLFFLASLFFFLRFLRNPGVLNVVLAGISLGLAQTAKFTSLFLFILYPVILAVFIFRRNQAGPPLPSAGRAALKLAVIFLIALLVINTVYFWEKSGTPLGDYGFETAGLRLLNHPMMSWMPAPLPFHFLKGIDRQRSEKNYTFYLFGEMSQKGWWYYFPVAFLVKTPIPLLLLIILAFFVKGIGRQDIRLVLGIPFIFYALFFMFFSHKYIGLRYLLPLMPVVFIFASRSALLIASGKKLVWSALCVLGLWYLACSIRIYPHYLSYFNEIAGGPSGGHRVLADSNIDWGQDLIGLRKYMEKKQIPSIHLAYFGRVDPGVYGIRFQPLGEVPEPGLAAVSINYLKGFSYFLYYQNEAIPIRPYTFSWINRYEPIDRVGYSILVYNIPGKPEEEEGLQE